MDGGCLEPQCTASVWEEQSPTAITSRAERPCPAGTLSFLAVCPARPLAPWDSVLSALPRGSGLAITGGGTGGQTVLVHRGQENVLWALGAKRGESSPSSKLRWVHLTAVDLILEGL